MVRWCRRHWRGCTVFAVVGMILLAPFGAAVTYGWMCVWLLPMLVAGACRA